MEASKHSKSHAGGAMEDDEEKKKQAASRSLMTYVFSWSIKDILNKNLYKNKVSNIPLRFSSLSDYKDSFGPALIEEVHADMFSGITSVSRAPVCQIISVAKHPDHKHDSNLLYVIRVRAISRAVKKPEDLDDDDDDDDVDDAVEKYKPAGGDLIALAVVKPKCIDDLNRPPQLYTIALVQSGGKDVDDGSIKVLTSKPVADFEEIEYGEGDDNVKKRMLFGVYLINMATSLRIQAALCSAPEERTSVIKTLVRAQPDALESCAECVVDETRDTALSTESLMIRRYGPNESQEAAILNCIAASQCEHQNSVKLIWGPPGTGKTKLVGVLLRALLRLKTKTLVCGPTNTAVLQVAGRLLKLVREELEIGGYGLGDVVLFGNKKRMRVEDGSDGLLDVFFDHRVEVLEKCLPPETGWRGRLKSLIHLLENSEDLYTEYLAREAESETLVSMAEHQEQEQEPEPEPLTYEEFLMEKLEPTSEGLKFCIENLPTHLPTSSISLEVVKCMIQGKELLESLEDFLISQNQRALLKLRMKQCLQVFKSLERSFPLENLYSEEAGVGSFCLAQSQLVFCTASSAARLSLISFRMLIIDEAAQLKECESLIPLQVLGLSHAVLIGDEKQLSAMVKSNISESVNFGRSLFERLVLLGHKKHLLNVQYRMHPSISLFPNQEFYGDLILNAHCVRTRSYERRVLDGGMYGTYSFINVSDGKEEFDAGHSLTNPMEVVVALSIVTKLFKACAARKEKMSVGVISPYKAQMYAIKNVFDKRFPTYEDSYCTLNVRSVDGFQGGEDDVIIVSTVRSNSRGSVGFLSNHKRTNVALTRARHCLWILGNGETLMSSDSIWKKLVVDAQERDSFFHARDDPGLSQHVTDALLGLGRLDIILETFKSAKWKMRFSGDFSKSMAREDSIEIQKSVLQLLEKLSSGRREDNTVKISVGSSASSELLELYKLSRGLYLAWSVDVEQESSGCTQIIKIWDVLRQHQVAATASRIDELVGNYTVNMLNRCKQRCVEESLVVPMSWPVEGSRSFGDLSRPFAALSLGENQRAARNRDRNNKPKSRW